MKNPLKCPDVLHLHALTAAGALGIMIGSGL